MGDSKDISSSDWAALGALLSITTRQFHAMKTENGMLTGLVSESKRLMKDIEHKVTNVRYELDCEKVRNAKVDALGTRRESHADRM